MSAQQKGLEPTTNPSPIAQLFIDWQTPIRRKAIELNFVTLLGNQ